ncbi:MAG: efflux RND transporter periplasmic adaptor subunit [Pseudohongiellaceae bacterium]
MSVIVQTMRNKSMRNFVTVRGQANLVRLGAALLLSSLLVSEVSAQQAADAIELTQEDAIKLGVQFESVRSINDAMGIELPAQVIAPLDEGSHAYSLVDGVISDWRASSGDRVLEGEVIARIASNVAGDLQAQWLDADASLSAARLEASRSERLFENGVIAERRLQQVQLALAHAESREASNRRALEQLGFDASSIDRLAESKANLGYALLRAPREGLLVHRARSVGEPVAVGDKIAEFQSSSAKWVSVILPAALADTLGNSTKLSLMPTGETLTLRERDYSIDPLTQTIELYAEFDTEVNYPLGSLIDVFVLPSESGVLVPASAIVYTEGNNYVYVKTVNGVTPRQLDLIPIGRDYLVHSGLRAGEQIAVSGTALLKGMQLGLGGDS